MALINCPECNKQVSDKATSCPNCGMPLSSNDTLQRKGKRTFLKIATLFTLLGVIGYYFTSLNKNKLKAVGVIMPIEKADSISSKIITADSAKSPTISSSSKINSEVAEKSKKSDLPVKSKNRKVFCWYGYQEKKLGSSGPPYYKFIVHSVVNYSTEIIELTVPSFISDGEVSQIVEKHVKKYCPFTEKEEGKNYHYTITGKMGPIVRPTLEEAISSRTEELGTPVTFSVCALDDLQNSALGAQHYSYDDPNKYGVNLYCVVFWSKMLFDPIRSINYVSSPIKIKCANRDDINMIGDLLKYHIKNNCSDLEGFEIGVSSMETYQGALDYIQEQFPESEQREVCRLDFFQQVICNKK